MDLAFDDIARVATLDDPVGTCWGAARGHNEASRDQAARCMASKEVGRRDWSVG